jgi:hypothetical protein
MRDWAARVMLIDMQNLAEYGTPHLTMPHATIRAWFLAMSSTLDKTAPPTFSLQNDNMQAAGVRHQHCHTSSAQWELLQSCPA